MEKFRRIDSIQIGLASSDQIRKWAERKLPNGRLVGQVTNPQTVNYKTLRPEPGGLFCEKIFGPVKDYECACGKKRTIVKKKFCPDCEVEFAPSRIRRYRLGFIQLASPVAHIWYLKGTPSYLSILLDMPRKKVEAVIYCTEMLSITDTASYTPKQFIGQSLASSFKEFQTKPYNSYSLIGLPKEFSWESQEEEGLFRYYATAQTSDLDKQVPAYNFLPSEIFAPAGFPAPLTGAKAIFTLLKNMDIVRLERQLAHVIFEIDEEMIHLKQLKIESILFPYEKRRLNFLFVRRARILKRLKLVRQFRSTKTQAEWLVLLTLPVLPPDLRPIIQLDSEQVAVSDLNKLYQKVLFRNNRMKRHQRSQNLMNQSDELNYAQRLLQEAVDSLIENGKGGADPITASNDRPLKSLSDMLKGKKGRFRQNLLGKRVDYSGRSVIVVGPHLELHECGIPKEMAIELFQPFLIQTLLATNVVRTILGAKHLIYKKDPKVWKCLEQTLRDHPVLLNRAPTLHRLGIQAFQPKLVPGRAIHLHPLVCPAFNADFDGDQMAVHVPLSYQARSESWNLMWSRNNLLSPATGQPILVPSQDMVLGCYYLTTLIPETNLIRSGTFNIYFSKLEEILQLYALKKFHSHTSVWLKVAKPVETDISEQEPIEIQITQSGTGQTIFTDRFDQFEKSTERGHHPLQMSFIRTTPGRIFLNDIFRKTMESANISVKRDNRKIYS